MESQQGQRLGQEADRYAVLGKEMTQQHETAEANKVAIAEVHVREVTDLKSQYEAQLQVCRSPTTGCKELYRVVCAQEGVGAGMSQWACTCMHAGAYGKIMLSVPRHCPSWHAICPIACHDGRCRRIAGRFSE